MLTGIRRRRSNDEHFLCRLRGCAVVVASGCQPPKRQVPGSPETQGMVVYVQNCQTCHGAAEGAARDSSLDGVVDRVERIMLAKRCAAVCRPCRLFPISTIRISNTCWHT